MILALFSTTVFSELLSAACVTFSLLRPEQRIWPPIRPGAWQSRLMWVFFVISGLGVIALGLLDWHRFSFPAWLRWIIGAPLWLGGTALAFWALGTLGMEKSFGGTGKIIRRGPYRFSRNPQYVGFIASLLGWGLATSSLFTLVAAFAGTVPLLLAPFSEEPWLAKMYGAAYQEYLQSVPRFLGRVKHSRSTVL